MTAPFTGDSVILAPGGSGKPREQHPVGQAVAKCVDVIDLGERVEQFQGVGPKKLSRKVVFVFMTEKLDSEGRFFEVDIELTLSSGDKARLPQFLGTWRGSPYTPQEIKAGIPLHEYVGKYAILTMANKPTKSGKNAGLPRSVIYAAGQMFPGIPVPSFPPYTRKEFWGQRKAEAKAEADAFRAEASAQASGGTVALPPSGLTQEQAMAHSAGVLAAAEEDIVPF